MERKVLFNDHEKVVPSDLNWMQNLVEKEFNDFMLQWMGCSNEVDSEASSAFDAVFIRGSFKVMQHSGTSMKITARLGTYGRGYFPFTQSPTPDDNTANYKMLQILADVDSATIDGNTSGSDRYDVIWAKYNTAYLAADDQTRRIKTPPATQATNAKVHKVVTKQSTIEWFKGGTSSMIASLSAWASAHAGEGTPIAWIIIPTGTTTQITQAMIYDCRKVIGEDNRAWCAVVSNAIGADYALHNVAGVTHNGTGDYTITLTNGPTMYGIVDCCQMDQSPPHVFVDFLVKQLTATTISVKCFDRAGTPALTDVDFYFKLDTLEHR